MKNIEGTSPFEFRKPVTGGQFINHKKALDEICSGLGVKTIYFVLGDQLGKLQKLKKGKAVQ